MKVSELFFSTLRETPAEAEVVSHQLMMRAGMIRKVTSGVYSYMPLAYRVLKKIMNIVRDEMDKAGSQEVMLPIIQPSELWQKSGRWDVYGDEMWRLQDRHGRDFCLGPTHEEVITDLVKGEVKSYKQLPLRLYQIQNKYRDERRPRFGLMRGREFIMKDLYSFDRDEAGLDICYQDMYQAYTRIFNRCGLEFRPVQADTGAIGGNASHEFMVLAESGEAEVVYCDSCNYTANVEIAPAHPEIISAEEQMEALEEVHTPNIKTIEEVTKFLNVPANKLIKTLCYQADKELIAVLIRGDRKVNEIKLKNTLGCVFLELASENEVKGVMGASPGSVGPIGLKNIKILADYEVSGMINAVCGANKDDYHTINVNPGRDFKIGIESDIRLVEPGERCPECEGKLLFARGIEVGQVFKLQTKYSNAMGAKYLDDNGQEQLMVMGCYGIGVSRTMAAAIEQNHDENGIVWPMSIAPYHVMVVPVSIKDETQTQVAETIYQGLLQDGVEVLYDDRNERPGVKFKDADLIGFPIRITVGAKTLAEGKVEIKVRSTGEVHMIEVDKAINYVKSLINNNK